jgi:hypothetical protein
MHKTIEQLRAEARYAVRLCQRTARLYRRAQTVGTFLSIVGGSAVLAALSPAVPSWVTLAGTALLSLAGAALVAMRPADKAAQNEADQRRYMALLARAHGMTPEALGAALDDLHQSGAAEVEPLRAVAYNDVMLEINRPDALIPLRLNQRLLASLA